MKWLYASALLQRRTRGLSRPSTLAWALHCTAVRSSAARTTPTAVAPLAVQRRWKSNVRETAPGGDTAATAASHREPRLGVVEVTSKNINSEMESKVPMFLYFMVSNHLEVRAYTDLVVHQVDQANRRLRGENFQQLYQEFGKDAGLAIKVGLVDCLKEQGLTTKFNIDPHMFPIIYFVRNKLFCDKLVGIVTESQVKEAAEAFIEYGKTESENEKQGKGIYQQLQRTDNDDENAMTLITAAHSKMQNNDANKARELYEKALRLSEADIKVVNKRYGVGQKKMTQELWKSLKREMCYNTAPEALCGMAMCALAKKNKDEALQYTKRVRAEFPLAVRDLRSVAMAVVRVELIHLIDFNVDRDNYLTLLKYEELMSDRAAFYPHHLKKAVAFFMEGNVETAIEECIRLIRAEPKLLPTMKETGIVAQDMQLGPSAVTPARQVILAIFEALGADHEEVRKGRKLLQLYV